eukprot:5932212-Pyramimonas_sp.AAC.1
MLGFADDSTALCQRSTALATERRVIETSQSLGEEAHAGKTERICFNGGSDGASVDGWVSDLRLVGGWLSQDGTTTTDADRRIHAARL